MGSKNSKSERDENDPFENQIKDAPQTPEKRVLSDLVMEDSDEPMADDQFNLGLESVSTFILFIFYSNIILCIILMNELKWHSYLLSITKLILLFALL